MGIVKKLRLDRGFLCHLEDGIWDKRQRILPFCANPRVGGETVYETFHEFSHRVGPEIPNQLIEMMTRISDNNTKDVPTAHELRCLN